MKERNSVSHQIGSSTSLVSWGHRWSHLHTVDSDCPHVQVCLPRPFEGLRWVGVHAKESVLFLMRNIAEYHYYPIKSIISHQSKREVHLRTSRIFDALAWCLNLHSQCAYHMALAVSMAPIFVIWLMTVMFARLTTWAKHLLQTCDLFLTFVTLSLFLCLSSVYFLFTLSLSLFIHALERSRLHPFHIFIIISHVTYLLSHAYDISHVNRYHMPTFYHMLLYLLRL